MKKRKPVKKITRRRWSQEEIRELRSHSKKRTTIAKIAKAMKRSEAALRQQAFKLRLPLGHAR